MTNAIRILPLMNDYPIGCSTLLLCEFRNEEKLREKMSSRKRKILTLEDRVKVVERLSKGESARSIALSLNVGKTQVLTIAKEKDDILCCWKDGKNGDRKYGKYGKRKCAYEDLNEAVWGWFCEAR